MVKKQKNEKSAQRLGSRVLKASYDAPNELVLEKSSSRSISIFTLIMLLLSVIVAAYIFPAHGSLASISLGSVPVKADEPAWQIRQKIDEAVKSYQITLEYPDGSQKNYLLAKAGLTIDAAASVQSAKKTINRAWLERLSWWRPLAIPLDVKTNPVIYKSFISRYATIAEKPVKNSALSVKNGRVTISQPAAGSGHAVIAAQSVILDSVANLSHKPLKLEPSALRPAIVQADLTVSQAKAERVLSQKVVLNIAGEAIVPSKADIGKWLDLSPVPSAKTVDVRVNSGKVLEYINSAAAPYIKPPRSKLVINDAGTQKVLDYGEDGSDVINKDKAAAQIASQLADEKGVNIDLTVRYAPNNTVNVKAYAKWLIVDVTTKRMYAYEKDKLVKSFLVSAGAPLTPTVEGQFSIFRKVRVQDMRGANADGSRYFQPSVQYVNYFFRDYAIHGNYWRPLSYFGNVNSSHGCVGIVNSDAAWIYDWAVVGTPVIVHS